MYSVDCGTEFDYRNYIKTHTRTYIITQSERERLRVLSVLGNSTANKLYTDLHIIKLNERTENERESRT